MVEVQVQLSAASVTRTDDDVPKLHGLALRCLTFDVRELA